VSSKKTPGTVAAVDPQALESEALSAIEAAGSEEELDQARVWYLGRKSDLKLALREVRDREHGKVLNELRKRLEAAVTRRGEEFDRKASAHRPEEEFDTTLPGDTLARGHLHVTTQIRREVEDIFLGLGYQVVDGREVETTRYNFDALNMPPWHPVRSPRQTLFLDADTVLRSETSPSQIRTMEQQDPPIYMITTGRVYRRDTPDVTHAPTFHQVEGLAIDEGITLADLKGTLLHVMRALFGEARRVRFRTHFFPFTEPSMEPDVSCFACDGSGCATCKFSGWIEMGGSGMVDPALYEFVGTDRYDPERISGFAFGLGLERIAQLRHGIPDVRLFWQNDLRVLSQF
jgi:phenylalanyl-tRNA synthetase alpha chain